MSNKVHLEATSSLTGSAATACVECEEKTAAPCFNLDHVAKALGSSTVQPNAALTWFKEQFAEPTVETCVPGSTFRQTIYYATLQPVWSSPYGRKSLAEALVCGELYARAIDNLGDTDKERLSEGIDGLIWRVLLEKDSQALYDPRKGASLKTYIRHIASKRIGGMLRKIGNATNVKPSQVRLGDDAAPTAPLEPCSPPTQIHEISRARRSRQFSEAHYDLLEARIYEEEVAAVVHDWLMAKAQRTRTQQQADALSRSARLMPDIARWRPELVWLLDLETGLHTHRFPMRVYIAQQVATTQFNHPNGTVLENLIRKHCVQALRDLLEGPSPHTQSLQQSLQHVRGLRERARHALTANVDHNDWAAFVNIAAANGPRNVRADAPALLLHMIPWSDIEAHARGQPGS